MINIQKLSRAFEAKTLGEAEIDEVRALCCENELFYSYCPPFVTAESIRADMRALPKNKEQKDKLYVGFYDASELVAVMEMCIRDRYNIGINQSGGLFLYGESNLACGH